MRAAGIGLWRLAMPYFAVGAVFGVAVFLIGEFWLPSADDRAKFILERRQLEPGQRNEAAKLDFYNEATHSDWTIGHFNRLTGEILQLKLTTKSADGSIRTLDARRALHRDGHWLLYDVLTWNQLRNMPTPTPAGSNAVLSLTLPETPAWIRSELKFATLRATDVAKGPVFSIREILDYLRLHPQIDARRKSILWTQLQGRLAAPFTCLAVVLIALPFGARTGRHNVFVGVASSIFICFGYFILQRISFGLGVGGVMPAILAAWLPNIVCGGAGLLLLSRVR
jgi:lipopolysaccharide export system permease protein